jgi:hypothetical protein
MKKDTNADQQKSSILLPSLMCSLVDISQASEVTRCAMTIVATLFICKSGMCGFCTDELWISSVHR